MKEGRFEEMLDLLGSNGLLAEADRDEFDSEFMDTNRSTVNVCPGVSLHYRWGRSEALQLDDNDRFVKEIDERVLEAVRTWGGENAWNTVISAAG